MPPEIRVPEGAPEKQLALLRDFLERQAHSYLIPRLEPTPAPRNSSLPPPR
ncbi:Uncharacterised protein [Neisseria gonorrhoeae]|nr:Uncharacterised protein [Neisseria gonorrhoeae]